MKRTMLMSLTAAGMIAASTAIADPFTDKVVANLEDLGYTVTEVKQGPTQSKFEGLRGTQKIEVVYDRTTGAILKEQRGLAGDADVTAGSGAVGPEIVSENRDFVAVTGNGNGGDDDASDDNGGHDDGSDDDGDDRDHDGSDDDGGDDRDHDGSDDDGGDRDHGGSDDDDSGSDDHDGGDDRDGGDDHGSDDDD